MADTALAICSRALISLGANPITSFSSQSNEAKVASQLYEATVRGMLSMARWKFSRSSIQLARKVGTPSDGIWSSAYALPSDWLETQAVMLGGCVLDYETYEGEIRTGTNPADVVILKYIRRVPEANFPASFVTALEAELQARFAFPVTAQESLMGVKRREATGIARQAKSVQAQGEPAPHIRLNRFRAARRGRG